MYLGENIKYLRVKNKMSQDFIAERYGYKSYTTVQKWESNVADPPASVVQDLARLFKVSIDDLYNSQLYLGEAPNCSVHIKDEVFTIIDIDTLNQMDEPSLRRLNTYAQNLLAIQQMEEPVLMAAHHDNPTEEQQEKIIKDMDILKRPNK